MKLYEILTLILTVISIGVTGFFSWLMYRLNKRANKISKDMYDLEAGKIHNEANSSKGKLLKEWKDDNNIHVTKPERKIERKIGKLNDKLLHLREVNLKKG